MKSLAPLRLQKPRRQKAIVRRRRTPIMPTRDCRRAERRRPCQFESIHIGHVVILMTRPISGVFFRIVNAFRAHFQAATDLEMKRSSGYAEARAPLGCHQQEHMVR